MRCLRFARSAAPFLGLTGCLLVRSDPCGQAGGKYLQTPVGGDSVFQTVSVPGDKTYKMGDLGSKVLPEHPDAVTTWKIGTTPRVAWGMRYNQCAFGTFCFLHTLAHG